jgi:hypothetical protein
MHLSNGFRGHGFLDLFFRTGGGYYLNVGASGVICAGGIHVLQADRIDAFGPAGARLKDGSLPEAGLAVLAAGYRNRKYDIAEQFGEEIAEGLGPCREADR